MTPTALFGTGSGVALTVDVFMGYGICKVTPIKPTSHCAPGLVCATTEASLLLVSLSVRADEALVAAMRELAFAVERRVSGMVLHFQNVAKQWLSFVALNASSVLWWLP